MHTITFKSRRDKTTWMDQCLNRIGERLGDGDEHALRLPEELARALRQIRADWQQANEAETRALGQYRSWVHKRKESLKMLALVAGHARTSVTCRAGYEGFGPKVRIGFGLHKQRPTYSGSRGWLELAADLLKGDKVATAEGYEAMAQPAAPRIAALLAEAEHACKLTDDTDLQLQRAQRKLRLLSDEITKLCADIAAYLRYVLRRRKPSERRRIMRNFGYAFKDPKTGRVEEPITEREPREPVPAARLSKTKADSAQPIAQNSQKQEELPKREGPHGPPSYEVQDLMPRDSSPAAFFRNKGNHVPHPRPDP